jgi:hypothetical protein
MNTLAIEIRMSVAESVSVSDDTLSVNLDDGRTILVPTAWYPRLQHATPIERRKWRLIGRGRGIHWEDIDEDISIEGLLAGKQSGESQTSFKTWLELRQTRTSKRSTGRVKTSS